MIQKSNAHRTSQPWLLIPLSFCHHSNATSLCSLLDTCPDLPEGSRCFSPASLSTSSLGFSAPAVKMITPALLQCRVTPLNEKKHYQMKNQGKGRPSHPAFPGYLGKWVQQCSAFVAIVHMLVPVCADIQTGQGRLALPTLLHFGSAP